jgi:hypothetical protein
MIGVSLLVLVLLRLIVGVPIGLVPIVLGARSLLAGAREIAVSAWHQESGSSDERGGSNKEHHHAAESSQMSVIVNRRHVSAFPWGMAGELLHLPGCRVDEKSSANLDSVVTVCQGASGRASADSVQRRPRSNEQTCNAFARSRSTCRRDGNSLTTATSRSRRSPSTCDAQSSGSRIGCRTIDTSSCPTRAAAIHHQTHASTDRRLNHSAALS